MVKKTLVLPAINADSFQEIVTRLRVIEELVKGHPASAHWAHIDVADGSASEIKRWHDPKDLHHVKSSLNLELHLMERVTLARLKEWRDQHVRRIYVHPELCDDIPALIAYAHEERFELGLALFRTSQLSTITPYITTCAGVLVLAVTPGMSGEDIDMSTLERIQKIRELSRTLPITLDGGVRIGIAHDAIRHGATRLVAASAIFNQSDPTSAYERLLHDAESACK